MRNQLSRRQNCGSGGFIWPCVCGVFVVLGLPWGSQGSIGRSSASDIINLWFQRFEWKRCSKNSPFLFVLLYLFFFLFTCYSLIFLFNFFIYLLSLFLFYYSTLSFIKKYEGLKNKGAGPGGLWFLILWPFLNPGQAPGRPATGTSLKKKSLKEKA